MGLMQQERLVREWNIVQLRSSHGGQQQLSQDDDTVDASPSKSSSSSFTTFTTSKLQLLWHNVLFERHHTMNAAAVVSFFCASNAAFYFLLDAAVNQIKSSLSIKEEVYFYLGTCAIAIALMRLSGDLWDWLDKESYNLVKFELHNRESLGYRDAKLFRWLRGYTLLKSCLNMLSFYLLYSSIVNLYYVGMDKLAINPLLEWYGVVGRELKDLMPDHGGGGADVVVTSQSCDSYLEYIPDRLRGGMAHRLCADEDLTIVQNAYHVAMFLGTAAIYTMLGENFIESLD
jgi:hypothetical protein